MTHQADRPELGALHIFVCPDFTLYLPAPTQTDCDCGPCICSQFDLSLSTDAPAANFTRGQRPRRTFAAREQLISRAHAGMTQRLPSGHPAAVYASIQEYRLVLREFCDRDNRTARPLHRLVQQSVTQSSSRSHALAPDPDPGIVRPQRSPVGATLLVVSVCI